MGYFPHTGPRVSMTWRPGGPRKKAARRVPLRRPSKLRRAPQLRDAPSIERKSAVEGALILALSFRSMVKHSSLTASSLAVSANLATWQKAAKCESR